MTDFNSVTLNRIYNCLSETEHKTRSRICMETCLSDRQVRRGIHELRDAGIPVCSDSHSKGYWLGNRDDVSRCSREMRARAYKLMHTARKMDTGEIEGQEEINVLV